MSRKYEQEIESLLVDLFFEDSMTKEEWNQFRRTIFTKSGITYDELESSLDEGIQAGFTLKQQLIILRKQFANIKSRD
jgi:hypothetical protein